MKLLRQRSNGTPEQSKLMLQIEFDKSDYDKLANLETTVTYDGDTKGSVTATGDIKAVELINNVTQVLLFYCHWYHNLGLLDTEEKQE